MNDSDAKEAWSDIVNQFLHKISDNSPQIWYQNDLCVFYFVAETKC